MTKIYLSKNHIFPDDILINILGFVKQNGPMILSFDFKKKIYKYRTS